MPPSAFGIGTARTAGGKYDPDAIRFQTLYRLFFRSDSNASMVCPSTPGAPLLALTRRYASHTSHFEISNDFPCDTDLPTRILPGTLVDRTNNPRWSGPFAPPPLQGLHHYYEPVRQHAPRRYSTLHSFCCLVLFLLPPQTLRAEVSGPAFPRSMQQPQTEVCCSHRTVTQEGRISPEEEGSLCRSTVSSLRSTATKRC